MPHIRRCSPRSYPVKISPNPCLNCGGPIIGRSAAAKFCGSHCAEKSHTKDASVRRAAKRAVPRNLAVPGKPVAPGKPCRKCGTMFVNSQSRIKFCSNKCRHDYWHLEDSQ